METFIRHADTNRASPTTSHKPTVRKDATDNHYPALAAHMRVRVPQTYRPSKGTTIMGGNRIKRDGDTQRAAIGRESYARFNNGDTMRVLLS